MSNISFGFTKNIASDLQLFVQKAERVPVENGGGLTKWNIEAAEAEAGRVYGDQGGDFMDRVLFQIKAKNDINRMILTAPGEMFSGSADWAKKFDEPAYVAVRVVDQVRSSGDKVTSEDVDSLMTIIKEVEKLEEAKNYFKGTLSKLLEYENVSIVGKAEKQLKEWDIQVNKWVPVSLEKRSDGKKWSYCLYSVLVLSFIVAVLGCLIAVVLGHKNSV